MSVKKMRIYLASRYSRLEELNVYAGQLREAGFEVTSRWLLDTHQVEGAEVADVPETSVPMEVQATAQEDYEDVLRAQLVISFTEKPRSHIGGHGGRHVEFGMALAWGKHVLIVGPRENVFHTLPEVQHFAQWGPEVIAAIGELGCRTGRAVPAS